MVDDAIAFPKLDEDELAVLGALGTLRSTAAGEYLYREGDTTYDFYVVLSGAVDIVLGVNSEERLLARHGPGRFLGELNLLTGMRVYVSARVAEPGEVLVVSRAVLQQVIATRPRLGDTILGAFVARRSVLLHHAAPAIRVIGSRFSPQCHQIREFLARIRIPHEWVDPDRDADVERLLHEFGLTAGELPVVIATGSVLRNPTTGALAEFLGLTIDRAPGRLFDIVVVGAGPAGLAAAVYGASEGLQTVGIEALAAGGQAGASPRIENYLGFPTGIAGGDLVQRAVVQAEKFGAHLTLLCAATSLREEARHLVVRLSDGTDVTGRTVIAATGARYRRLEASRLREFEGRGVYYAATEIEAHLCAASPVVVVGGGNSAGQAALFLAERGNSVTIVVRRPDLGAGMSRYLVERIQEDSRIEARTNAEVTHLEGDEALESVRVRGPDGDVVLSCAALFSFIGAEPTAAWLSGYAAVDGNGFVLTDGSLGEEHLDSRWHALARRPLPFETSCPGLFAVGDVRAGSTKRVAAAVGEGAASMRSVHEYLAFAH